MAKLYEIRNLELGDKTITIHTVRTGGGDTDFLSGGARRAEGGPVFGAGSATSDSIPALLSNGEYVVRAAAVDHYGMETFDRMNAMRLAGGGSTDKKRKKRNLESDDEANDAQAARLAKNIEDMLAGQQKATQEWMSAAEVQKSSWKTIADDLATQMATIGAAATSPFNSSLFGGSGGAWGSGQAGWRGALNGDIAGLAQRDGLIAQLSAAGASPEALKALFDNGATNTDIAGILASGSVGEFNSLIAERARLTGSVGQSAGQAAYGAEFAVATGMVAEFSATISYLTGQINQINALQSPTSKAAAEGYAKQGQILADAVGGAVVNGFNKVARRGTGGY